MAIVRLPRHMFPRWGELEQEDEEDVDVLLPAPHVIGPDKNGIKKVIEYKFNVKGEIVKVTTTTRVRKIACARLSKRALERRSWAKFGDAVNGNVGGRLTMVSTEDIFLERPGAPGTKPEETNYSNMTATGDSLSQLGKGVLMVCRACGKKGDHWTSKCPFKDLAPPLSSDKPTSAASNSTYVPPNKRAGAADRRGSSDTRQHRNDQENAIRIGNLSEETQEDDLVDLCRPFGVVLRAHVSRSYETGLSRGYGFVNFLQRRDAELAVQKLNGYGYDNLILTVEMSVRKIAN